MKRRRFCSNHPNHFAAHCAPCRADYLRTFGRAMPMPQHDKPVPPFDMVREFEEWLERESGDRRCH